MRIFARALRLVTARCVLLAERQFVQRVGEVRVAVNRNLCARRLARPPGALRPRGLGYRRQARSQLWQHSPNDLSKNMHSCRQ